LRTILLLFSFLLYHHHHHRSLHPFPTRRSSDLFDRIDLGHHDSPQTRRDHRLDICFLESGRGTVDADVDGSLTTDILEMHQRFRDRKSTRLNSSHEWISYAVFCLKKKKKTTTSDACCIRSSACRFEKKKKTTNSA